MRGMSLFAGIGGFDLAAEWMGWQTDVMVEWNPFCQQVLKKNFPNTKLHGDITTFDGKPYRDSIDIIWGGFPCQPFSISGNREGTSDDRYLWPEMLRVIEEVNPVWVVAENVYGILSEDDGNTINLVCSQLESLNYQKPVIFDCSADAFDLPTLERHIWVVTQTAGIRPERSGPVKIQNGHKQREFSGTHQREIDRWHLPESRLLRVGERLPGQLDSIAAFGNAIPPEVAHQIFRTIQAIELNS